MRTKLPPLPVGDRFKDVLAFRVLGLAQGQLLLEAWEDAVKTYGQACYDKGHDDGRAAGYTEGEIAGQC